MLDAGLVVFKVWLSEKFVAPAPRGKAPTHPLPPVHALQNIDGLAIRRGQWRPCRFVALHEVEAEIPDRQRIAKGKHRRQQGWRFARPQLGSPVEIIWLPEARPARPPLLPQHVVAGAGADSQRPSVC